MARSRDYQAEYARRIARGQAAGLTRSQARGHPRGAERHASTPQGSKPVQWNRRLEDGYKAIRGGKSLTGAARELHVSPERLRHYVLGAGLAERKGRRWVALPENRSRQMLMYSDGRAITVRVDREQASHIGIYMSAVGGLLETNNPESLSSFRQRSVIDAKGKVYPFETDPNAVYRLANTGSAQSFEQIYRIIM